MFELQPVLKSELLELRPLQSEDFTDLFAVASDPLIWEQHPRIGAVHAGSRLNGSGRESAVYQITVPMFKAAWV